LATAGLADLDAELEKLSMDSRRSPQRVWRCSSRGSAGEFPTVQLVGRQRVPRFSSANYDLKNRHGCQRMTVSGFTIVSGLDGILAPKRYSPTKIRRSMATEGHSLRHMPSLDVKVDDEGSGSQLPTRTRDRNNKTSTDQTRL